MKLDRAGFDHMAAEVGFGRVGIVLGVEVSRVAMQQGYNAMQQGYGMMSGSDAASNQTGMTSMQNAMNQVCAGMQGHRA